MGHRRRYGLTIVTTLSLGLISALCFGLSDFMNGVATKRSSAWPVAVLACFGATVIIVIAACFTQGHTVAADYAWSALSGIGNGMGTMFLYRGLARGRMGVVAPVSAVGAALFPVAVGVLSGEQPGLNVWLAILCGLPGIWLVSRTPESADTRPSGLNDAILAGVGFGLMFVGLGKVPEGHGLWPAAFAELVATFSLFIAALATKNSPTPRRPSEWTGLLGGVLAGFAVIGFTLAAQSGLLTVTAVLTSLYPAVTVVLAALGLRETIPRALAAGLAVCAATVVLIALA